MEPFRRSRVVVGVHPLVSATESSLPGDSLPRPSQIEPHHPARHRKPAVCLRRRFTKTETGLLKKASRGDVPLPDRPLKSCCPAETAVLLSRRRGGEDTAGKSIVAVGVPECRRSEERRVGK